MYEFWSDNVKPKNGGYAKLCYMDTDSFIVHVKTKDICEDIAENVEIKSGTSDFELNRPFPKGKNKKLRIKSKNTYLFKRKQ